MNETTGNADESLDAFEFAKRVVFSRPSITQIELASLAKPHHHRCVQDGSILSEFRQCLSQPMGTLPAAILDALTRFPRGLNRGQIAHQTHTSATTAWKVVGVLHALGFLQILRYEATRGKPYPVFGTSLTRPVIPSHVTKAIHQGNPPVPRTQQVESPEEYRRDMKFALQLLQGQTDTKSLVQKLLSNPLPVTGNYRSCREAADSLCIPLRADEHETILRFNLLRLRLDGSRRVTSLELGKHQDTPLSAPAASLVRLIQEQGGILPSEREILVLSDAIHSAPQDTKRMIALLILGGFLRTDGERVMAQNKTPLTPHLSREPQVADPLMALREEAQEIESLNSASEQDRDTITKRISSLTERKERLEKELEKLQAEIAQEKSNLKKVESRTNTAQALLNEIKQLSTQGWVLLSEDQQIGVPKAIHATKIQLTTKKGDRTLERIAPGKWRDTESKTIWTEVT